MGNFTFLDKNWPELAKMGNLAEHIVKYMLAYDGNVPLEILPQNVFNVSCVPWLHFEHFSSNTSNGDNKIIKMITLGKYAEINGRFLPRLQYRYLMPLLTVIIYCCFLTDCRKN